MARFLLSDGFYSKQPVVELVYSHGNGPLGFWMMLGSYHAQWYTYDVPVGARRLCGGSPKDVAALLSEGFLLEAERSNFWKLGFHGELWTLFHSRSGGRALIPAEIRDAVFERDGRACLRCAAVDDLTLDHIIPWSHGGPDTVENLRVLCRSCNSTRGNRVEVDA